MQINELLKLSEFFLSDNGGQPMGNIRVNLGVHPDAKVLAQMLDRLNKFCGRENVWFSYTVSGWITFRWIGGSQKFHLSLADRCRESNLSYQREQTRRILASYAEPRKPLAERSTEELRELARAAIGRMDRSTLLKMLGGHTEPTASEPVEQEGNTSQSQPQETPEKPEPKPLTQMTLKELKSFAKGKIRGYSRMRKNEVLQALQEWQQQQNAPGLPTSPQAPQTQPGLDSPMETLRERITRDSLSALSIRQLQNFARGKGIKNYWRLRKSDLIERLLDWDFNERFDRALPMAQNTLNPYCHAA